MSTLIHTQEDHTCACRNCEPTLAVELANLPGRFSVKNGGHQLNAYKGDEDISKTCWQLITGPHGFAWRFSEPLHPCRKCWGQPGCQVCAYVDPGDFRVASA